MDDALARQARLWGDALIWVDVGSLYAYATAQRRPSGIQRVEIEIQRALREAYPDRVRFCRPAGEGSDYAVVPWAQVVELFAGMADGPAESQAKPAVAPTSPARAWLRRQAHRLPSDTRLALGQTARALLQAGQAGASVPGTVARAMARRRHADAISRRAGLAGGTAQFRQEAARGGIMLSLGANWGDLRDHERIRSIREKYGLRHGMLLYDVIPLRRPEWCDHGLTRDFRRWFETTVPEADWLLTISYATALDVTWGARQLGVTLRSSPQPIPMGSGFGLTAVAADTSELPAPGTYVLFVSTLEARKNHALLLRVWRRLLEELPPDRVPTLVFAGRVGWLVADLMQQLRNADYLGGKIRLVEEPSDAAVAALYRGCLFTLYPSLYEGWGLPVTESLAFGRACLASDRTSLPEAGGDYARYFDPENAAACFDAVADWILHPEKPAQAAERIRQEFVPVPWSATADALGRALGLEPVHGSPARLR